MHIKKCLCGILACVLSLVSTFVITPTADAAGTVHWLQGDINDNGYVDLSDLTLFVKYANGFYPTTSAITTRLDLNENDIVDGVDYNLLYNYNMGTGTLNVHAKNRIALTNLNVESKTYLKYYNSNSPTVYTPYSLNVQRGNTLSKSMIDYLPRNMYYPETERSVVSLGDANRRLGSGFIVDKHTIATAAHCVCSVTSNTSISFFKNMKVRIYSADATTIDATYDVDVIHVPEEYMSKYSITHTSDGKPTWDCSLYDYALVEVSEDLSQYGIMPLGSMTDDFISSSKTVCMSGFTDPDGNSGNNYTWSRYYRSGTTSIDNDSNKCFLINHCCSLGQSGGPIYYQANSNSPKIAVGLNNLYSGDLSRSPRITPTLKRFYLSNNYLEY